MFLDGSGNVGYGRLDMCLGWYVKPARACKEQVQIDETEEPSKSTSKKGNPAPRARRPLLRRPPSSARGRRRSRGKGPAWSSASTSPNSNKSLASLAQTRLCAGNARASMTTKGSRTLRLPRRSRGRQVPSRVSRQMRFDLSVAPIVYLCRYRALGDRSALTVPQKMLVPIDTPHCHLPRLHPRSRSDFAVGFMSFIGHAASRIPCF